MNEENKQKAIDAFSRFLDTIQKLRSPNGCPWDKEQTPLSMRQALIEECFEATDAITQGSIEHAKEELGDIFLNTMMICYMFQQNKDFLIADSINELTDKLIRRHPHVFPNSQGLSCMEEKPDKSNEVLSQWEKIKETIEGRKADCILDEIPNGFPPLLKAQKMQKKAAKKGFQWKSAEDAKSKLLEELSETFEAQKEFQDCIKNSSSESLTISCTNQHNKAFLHLEEEIGDLLFATINYGRYLGVNAEIALARANQKFYQRFSYVQKSMKEKNIPMNDEHTQDMIILWNEAKNL